jgi:DNA-binding response OmpR family regulator
MSDSTLTIQGGGAVLSLSGSDAGKRRGPRLVVGGGPRFVAGLADHFRKQGWDVHTAATGADTIRLALRKRPAVVLLPTDADGESGFLICAKLRRALPRLRVILVGPTRTAEAEKFAGFVGAAFAAETEDPAELFRVVAG